MRSIRAVSAAKRCTIYMSVYCNVCMYAIVCISISALLLLTLSCMKKHSVNTDDELWDYYIMISKCCELVKLCHINFSSLVLFWDTVYLAVVINFRLCDVVCWQVLSGQLDVKKRLGTRAGRPSVSYHLPLLFVVSFYQLCLICL